MWKLIAELTTAFIVLTLFLFTDSSMASYYCSTQSGRGYIDIGDSMANVSQACGSPNLVKVNEEPDKSFSTTEYWMYNSIQVIRSSPLGVDQPEARVTSSGSPLTFEVQNGTVTAITQNGQLLQSTQNCGQPVKVGATSNFVLSNCGKPTSTNMQNTPSNKTKKTTVWTYDRGQYSSPLILEFHGQTLTAING